MNRRGLSLLEMTLAIGITSVIGAAIAAMMAASANSLSAKDDGRQSAIRVATTQVRLGAYIAPSRCIVNKSNDQITLWFEDTDDSKTVHASEVRWIQFDEESNILVVKFIDFPTHWTQSLIDDANIECSSLTDYDLLLTSFESSNLIDSIPLVDSIQSCQFWINTPNHLDATQVSVRFSLESNLGTTIDSIIDETIRLHQLPSEEQ